MNLSEENMSLELRIAGYEFPNLKNEPHDSDWLYIMIRVEHPRGSWTSTDPSLLTDEVARLADWLEAVADGRAVEAETGFIEPNLNFVLLEGDVRKVRVYFELESRPSWAAAAWAGLEDLWLEFAVAPDMLRDAAASLRSQLARFPTRGGL